MNSAFVKSIFAFALLPFFTISTSAQLYSLRTNNLRLVYYDKAAEYIIGHTARCFENALRFNKQLFSYTSNEEITVFLHDLRDYGNAGATVLPRNLVNLAIAPLSYVYETSPANERINTTLNHELVHLVTMDKPVGTDRFFRVLFGGKVRPIPENPLSMFYVNLTNPRWSSPRWYTEGIAVFLETWMAGGLGRALGAYDEMEFRTMVFEGSRFYDLVGLESEGTSIDFQAGALSYLYGTRFMSYLAYQYGPEKLVNWTSRAPGSRGRFSSEFRRAYGVPLDEEWSRWIQWEQGWQRANLASIQANPVTHYRPLSKRTLGSVSRAHYDSSTGKLYAAVRYPGQVAHIAAIRTNDGEIQTISDVKGAANYYVASLAYDQSNKTLFYTTDHSAWRDLEALDLKTGERRRLLDDVRTGDLAFNQTDLSLWGVRHYNGISTLVRIPYPYTEWNQVYSWPYGQDIFDLDISHDGTKLTAGLAEVTGKQKLILMEVDKVLKGDHSFEILFDFENSTPANFVFSQDDRYLYGTAYYSGVSNIYRYDFSRELMEVMSNSETGFFRPLPISNDSLITFRHTSKGFLPVMIAIRPQEQVNAISYLGQEIVEKYPVVTNWMVDPPSPERINIDSLTIFKGDYIPLESVKLASFYPIVEGYKDFAAYGLRFNFSDPVLLHNLDLTISYTPNKILPLRERFHASFNHRFWHWRVIATYNGASFYDLFGPTKVSRKGYSLGVQYKKYLVYDDPRFLDYTINLAGYGGLERLPDFQNVTATFDKLLTLKATLNYQFFLKSVGAVEEEKGVSWQIVSRSNYVKSKFFPRLHANLDYGFALPLDHSSIWLRNSIGYSFGDRNDPFANFYFGGFGNNWVDYQEIRRYREDYSFPGVEINHISGKSYGKILLEWTLPPIRFRRLGLPSLYCNWARIALFSSGIVTNIENKEDRREIVDLGAQLDFRLTLLSSLESTISLGYAIATERGKRYDEFMVSLKLLK